MNVGYDHKLLSSFYLWFDDRLNYFAETYKTGQSHTFQYIDTHDIPSNYIAYYSPYRQFVWASDKVVVPDYVTIDGSTVYDKNGIYIDYSNGRVLLNTATFGTSQSRVITGTFPYKTVNTYITDETEENVIMNSDFLISPINQTFLQQKGGFTDKIYTVPAVFLTLGGSSNKPFAFGGMDETVSTLRGVVITESNYTLDGIMSLFRDSTRTTFSLMDFEDFPMGEFNHIKSHPYKYKTLADAASSYCFIEDARVAKLTDRVREKIAPSKDYKVGFIDFEISKPRTPRQEFQRV
jgi:hypothetical protein